MNAYFKQLFALSSLLIAAQAPVHADIHDRIEYKLNRVLRDVEIINNEIINDTCCKDVLAIVTEDLSVDQQTLSIVEQILDCSCNCTAITQEAINAGGGTFTITQSGNYCLAENVVGVVAVNANCVCIDLSCHTLDAGGAANAISATGRESVKIFNGCVVNSSSAGVLLTNCAAVEVSDLAMNRNALDAIRASGTKGLSVHGINSVGTVSGERIVKFDSCDNVLFAESAATGYTSRIGAIVELNTCNAVSIEDVDVTGNTKANLIATASGDIRSMLVAVNASTGIDLVRVKVNNNTINNTNAGIRRFAGICLLNSNTCSMHQCETSNNIDIVGSSSGFDRFVFILATRNVIITDHQANNNSCTQPIGNLRVITAEGASSNIILDGCQANNNVISALTVDPGLGSEMDAIRLVVPNAVVRNCQANFNTVTDGGVGRVGAPLSGFLVAIEVGAGGLIENCQANNNSMGNSPARTFVGGIFVAGGIGGSVLNSTADNNTGSETAIGITLFSSPPVVLAGSMRIEGCSANSNSAYGIYAGGFPGEVVTNFRNISIVNCVANRNGSANPGSALLPLSAAGIFINAPFDVLIKDCQVYESASTATTNGNVAGIYAFRTSNVVIEDTNVYDSTTTNISASAHGILFDTVRDSKVIRTQLHRNKSAGVELVGSNTTVAIIECVAMDNDKGFEFAATSTASCCLVQDSRALSNVTAGFIHPAFPTPSSTTFIGNEAQCNGTNYVLGANTILLQSLTWSTSTLANVFGNADLGSRYANITMIP